MIQNLNYICKACKMQKIINHKAIAAAIIKWLLYYLNEVVILQIFNTKFGII